MIQKDFREIPEEEIEDFLTKRNIKKFRIKQINEWIWQKGFNSFEEMTSLSSNLRESLSKNFIFHSIKIDKEVKSTDGTIKYSFRLFDNELIEGVLIPSKNRITACISSQVGCSLDCAFCATGTLKLKRNLKYYEIFEHAFKLNSLSIKHFSRPISNIVFMGMGEPLLNYNNVLMSIEKITSKIGMGMSAKRITLSTAGISKMIRKLADDNIKFNLAISLHSGIDDSRSQIMSINKSNNLLSLKESILYFYQKTSIRITYEYILLKGINDNLAHAKKLADLCKLSPCKVNLIEYNPIDRSDYKSSNHNTTRKFIEFLEEKNIIVNLRRSRGKDIDAACGQLVNKTT